MKIMITAVHPDDAFYGHAKVVGRVGDFIADCCWEAEEKPFSWASGEMVIQMWHDTQPRWHYFYAIQFVEIV